MSPGTTTFGAASALDPDTGDIQFVFPTILAADVVISSPAGDMIFVGTPEQGVVVIDGRTQEILGSVDIPLVTDLAVSPDGATLFVVAGNPSFFAIVDVPTRQIVFALPLSGSGGAGLALSPDGRFAYAAQQATDDVAVIDVQTRSLVATIPLGAQPTVRTMVLSTDGQTLFVGVGAGVAVIDTTTNSLQTTLSLGHAGFGLALTPAGRLFVTSRTPTVTVVDTSTLQVAGTVTLPVPSADGITVSPDGQRVFVTATETVGFRQFRSFVVVLDAGTGAFREQFRLPDGVATSVAFRVGDPNRPQAPPGDFSTLTRNDQGTPQDATDDTWLRRMKDGTEHRFSASGLHLETRDRNGNRTVFGYDAADRLVSITDPVGGVTSLSYIGGKLTSITDPAGRTTQFSIDGAGDLAALTTPDGATTQYGYDGRHRVIAKTDPRGAVTQYQYDGFGRLSRVIHPTGEERTITPSDAQGLLNNVPAGTPATPIPVDVSAQLTDGLNRPTQIETDPLGAATQTIDPLGRTTTVKRSGNSLPLEITRPNGLETTLSYDNVGNLLRTVQRGPFIGPLQTFFTYEPVFNQVTSITDPESNTTAITYDANGNPTQITNALGNATTLAYDSRGLLSSVTDALGNVTTFTYDATGNLISTTDPRGNTTSLSYDAAGNVVTSTDALGRVTQFAYDAMNRLTQVTDASGGITQYTYDPNGNLTSVSDANGQTTTFTYDEVNQLIQTTNPLGQAKTFAYDLARNLVSTTDAKGQTISFTYDAANQLVQKTLPTGEAVDFDYDLVGNLTLAQDADSDLSFQYDGLGRVTRADTAASIAQPASTLTHFYDKNGNRMNTNFTSAGVGISLLYIHDALNRLTNLTSGGAFGVVTFTYDALSRRTSMILPNGAVANYTYDAASQLTSLVHDQAGSPIASFNYTYDAVGNRTSLTDLDGVNDYVYDGLNRLVQAMHPQPSNPEESFTYDPVGNRLSSHLSTLSSLDAANRLLEDSNFIYTYDANGNLIEKRNKGTGDLTLYSYDPENQLITVEQFTVAGGTTPVLVADYRYDALGRRIEKDVNGVITRYIYDNEDILLEVDGTGATQAITLHGPGIDEPLAVVRRTEAGFNRFIYHADGLGSISTLTNLNGDPVRTYTYDSFGRIVDETGTVTDPYTYTGREFDPETGLLYYRARYYDPMAGRFLQEDIFAGLVELPQTLNKYLYVLNDPQNANDPLGLASLTINAFLGVGVSVTFGMDENGKFVQVIGGVGLGAGVTFNPFGRFPVGPEDFPCGKFPPGTTFGLIGFAGQANATLGPFSTGVASVDGLGVAKAPSSVRPQATRIEKTGPTVVFSPKGSFGLGASGAAGVIVGIGGF
jgi:RHS repeat-associated protein